MIRLLLLPLLLLLAAPVFAQGRVQGIVRDAETREPLQFANIRIEGTLHGTTTDREGRFTLSVTQASGMLVTSYIGYRTARTNFKSGDGQVVIALTPTSVSMPEVTITPGDNPALRIIRNAIAAKEKRQTRLARYKLTSHSKIVMTASNMKGLPVQGLGRDSSMTAILETQTDAWWAAPDRYKEVVTARRQTAFIPARANIISSAFFIIDFSADAVTIGDRGSVTGPISEAGLRRYSYTLAGQRELDGRTVHKIDIRARDDVDPMLEGSIYIADSSWALTMVDVALNDAALPTFFKRLGFRQNFRVFGDDFWMPVDVAIDADVSVALVVSVDLAVSGLSVLQDYEINGTPFDEVFDRTVIKVLKEADQRDTTWWTDRTMIPTTPAEVVAYRKADSIKTAIDSARNEYGFGNTLTGKEFRWDDTRLSVPGLLSMYRFNRAEGHALSAALRMRQPFELLSGASLEAGYGAGDHRWKIDGSVSFRLFANPRFTATLRGFDRITDIDEDSDLWDAFNTTVSNLFAKYDYKDYYYRRGVEATTFGDLFFLFPTRLQLSYVDDASARVTSNWSVLRRDWPARDIPAVNEGRTLRISITTSFDDRNLIDNAGTVRRFGMRTHIPSIGATYLRSEHAGSLYEAVVASASMRGAVSFDEWGQTSYRMGVDIASGPLLTQELFNLTGSVDFFSGDWRFRTMSFREFGGTRRAVAFVSHNFGDRIFRLIGLPLLNRSGWGLLVFASAGWTQTDAVTRSLLTVPTRDARAPYYEAGFGIDRILLLFRVDVAWRLSHHRDGHNFAVGLSTPLLAL